MEPDLGRDKKGLMNEAVDPQDNSQPLNIFGSNFTNVKGDHYQIYGNYLSHAPELSHGELFFFQRLIGNSDVGLDM